MIEGGGGNPIITTVYATSTMTSACIVAGPQEQPPYEWILWRF